MWVLLAVLSAMGLAGYDICKKGALTTLGVYPVLLGSVSCSALLLAIPYVLSRICPSVLSGGLLYVPYVSPEEHLLIVLKSTIVLSSWVCAYYAMRRLPITVVTPLNATRPMWTLLGAMLIFGEVLNGYQWTGVVVALVSFAAFALVGIDLGKPRSSVSVPDHGGALLALLLAVLLGAASGLYDKHLMRKIDHNAVLVFYTWYQVLMLIGYGLVRRWVNRRRRQTKPQSLYRSIGWIVGISVFLCLADFVYLLALSDPDSLIAVVSLVRRGSVIITFAYGVIVLHERNAGRRLVCLIGIIAAMVLLLLGSL